MRVKEKRVLTSNVGYSMQPTCDSEIYLTYELLRESTDRNVIKKVNSLRYIEKDRSRNMEKDRPENDRNVKFNFMD